MNEIWKHYPKWKDRIYYDSILYDVSRIDKQKIE